MTDWAPGEAERALWTSLGCFPVYSSTARIHYIENGILVIIPEQCGYASYLQLAQLPLFSNCTALYHTIRRPDFHCHTFSSEIVLSCDDSPFCLDVTESLQVMAQSASGIGVRLFDCLS